VQVGWFPGKEQNVKPNLNEQRPWERLIHFCLQVRTWWKSSPSQWPRQGWLSLSSEQREKKKILAIHNTKRSEFWPTIKSRYMLEFNQRISSTDERAGVENRDFESFALSAAPSSSSSVSPPCRWKSPPRQELLLRKRKISWRNP
jgi:hypothetical protein